MNFKQKLGYMLIGCLFTIAGYIIASLGGDTTHAQQNEQVIDKIVCRELEVVNKDGKRVVAIGQLWKAAAYGGVVEVYDRKGKRHVQIVAAEGSGSMTVYSENRKEVATIRADSNGGGMSIMDEDGFVFVSGGKVSIGNDAGKKVVGMGVSETGGAVTVRNKDEKVVANMGVTESGDGGIQTYKGGWRTH